MPRQQPGSSTRTYHAFMVLRIALPGQARDTATTEVPLEMLSACHGRVQTQCETLGRLCAHLPRHGADAPAQEAAEAVLRYFRQAAPHHHADEEADLFPALLDAAGEADHAAVRRLTRSLIEDHRALESLWQRLEAALERVRGGDALALDEATVNGFVAAYARHIDREESELLPLAARLLDEAALSRVGAAMRERRGIPAA
jgi:hemerythrin-like domain-containing protein